VPPALAGAGLSSREIDVLALLLTRRTNCEIAEALGVASTTVRSHCRAVLRKLGATDRRALWRLVAAISPAPPPPRLGLAAVPESKFAEDCGVAAAVHLRDNPQLRQGASAPAGHTAGETCGYLRSGAVDESPRRLTRERDERSPRA
jgi:DNA-binding CsgD family transcriptional regulator